MSGEQESTRQRFSRIENCHGCILTKRWPIDNIRQVTYRLSAKGCAILWIENMEMPQRALAFKPEAS